VCSSDLGEDKDDLATTMIDLVHTLKRIRQEAKID
jgi:hypothetical protein